MPFIIRETTLSELRTVALDLAALDAEEVYAAGETPMGFLERAFYESACIRVVEHTKEGIVAVTGLGHNLNTAWLLNTAAVLRCKLEYLRSSGWLWRVGFKKAAELNGGPIEYFTNHIWEKHKDHLDWLKWCGANIYTDDARMVNGNSFIPFVIHKEELKV
ncbi:hypothetical protein [Chromobacterium haemolyticum]|uniref:hypothetical protein n=1 Tax=Chromobacterium TaxID=535 RepID=UPI0040577780